MIRSNGALSGQTEIEDLRRTVRASAARVIEALDAMESAGWIRYGYRLGVIDFAITRAPHAAEVTADELRALLSLGPADAHLFYTVLGHCKAADGVAWPGKTRLAGILGRSRRTVERGIRALAEAGLLLVRRVPWTKIPGFRWPRRTNPARKRVMVFARAPRPPCDTRTLSRSSNDLCRWVRQRLLKHICFAGAERSVVVPLSALPEDLRAIARDSDGGSGERAASLRAVGLTERQADWIAATTPAKIVELALRRLNERWRFVRRRGAYVVGLIRRLSEATG